MLGGGHPEAPPGLASPSLPQLRFVVVHSETGLDLAGQQGLPLSLPTLGRTHEAGKRERQKVPFLYPPLGTGKPLLSRGKGQRPSSPLTSPRLLGRAIHSWPRSFQIIAGSLLTITPN